MGMGGEGAIRKQPTVDAFIGCAKKKEPPKNEEAEMSENKMAAVLATFLLAKNNKNWGPPKIVTKETRWFCVCVGEGLGQPKTRTRCGCDRFYVLLFLESKTEVKGGGAGDIFLDLFFLFSLELLCWFLLRKADALRVSGLDTKKKGTRKQQTL